MLDALLIGSILVAIGLLIYCAVCAWYRYDTLMHETFCICDRCDKERIRREIMVREFFKRQDEISRR
jgi:hypothetical protein